MIRLGGQGIPAIEDPVELARAHKAFGYRAAYCPNRLSLKDPDRVRAFREAFAREDILLAECNAWGNMIDRDEEKAKQMRRRVCEQLALADEVGALCTVNYFGTFLPNSRIGPHPDDLTPKAFDLAVEVVREIVDAVKPKRAKFCLEMMQWMYPDSPESYLALIKAVDRPAFGAHLDPCNIIVSPRMYYDTGSILRRCFELLGSWIVSCHAKDLILRGNLALHLDEILPGQGNMDYRTYLTELNRLPREIPLMIEHLKSPEDYAAARDHIKGVGRGLGIDM
ncbi:MAG: sugar phosphate isomerase/epimerase [Candidatus Sumerlaeota bacterium]|nr:sugar phosphate isomerase/epimerase [Candidatus Sumerlaeota bacterium]